MDIEKINNLKLYCPNEDQTYKDPDKMVDSNGNKLYAYVTLVMLGDRYIPAAIVLAQSLIKLNSQADKVVLITPDVSEDGKKILSKFFDRVIEVNYVNVQNWRTKKQVHRKYLELVFTKFHLFNLTQYKKVLLIDADALVLKHSDHLFTLDAPAGCFIEDKDLFIYYDSNGNYKEPPETGIEWYNKYCDKLSHGMKIPKEFTDRVLNNFRNNGVAGGLMLLEPKVGEFDNIIKEVSHGRMKYLLENKFVWPEQQYLTVRYSGKWSSINPRFFGLQGYPDWSVLYGLQYGGDKPFMLDSKFDISERVKYRDYQLFHKFYKEILKENPDYNNSKVLEECNKMNKYFSEEHKLSRTDKSHININTLANIYRTTPNKISKENIDFYHTQSNRFYIPPNNLVKPMFDDIKEFDYMEPIKRLNKSCESIYYNNLIKSYNLEIEKKRLDEYNKIHSTDKNEIILQYIKNRKDTYIISIWNNAVPVLNELIDFLNKKGNVYFLKKLTLNYKEYLNLLCLVYDEFSYQDIYERMEKKMEWMKAEQSENDIAVIVFDNINNLKINGQGAEFKREIRNFCIDKLKEKNLMQDEIRGNDIIHINDHFYQTIEYAGLYFNENSLKLLSDSNMKNFMSNFFISSHLKFNTIRKWMYSNMSLDNINRLCLIGSIDLYLYGIRNLGDIDGIYLSCPDKSGESELIEQLNTSFSQKQTKINFVDIGIKNSKYWKTSWEEKNKKVLDYFNIDSFDDIIYNPKYHFNFHGVKIYLIDYELVRKINRLTIKNYPQESHNYYHKQVAKDYTDFIMMYFYHRNLLGHYAYLDKDNKIKINDDFKIESVNLKDYDENKKSEFIETIMSNLNRYLKHESNKINKDIIISLF